MAVLEIPGILGPGKRGSKLWKERTRWEWRVEEEVGEEERGMSKGKRKKEGKNDVE